MARKPPPKPPGEAPTKTKPEATKPPAKSTGAPTKRAGKKGAEKGTASATPEGGGEKRGGKKASKALPAPVEPPPELPPVDAILAGTGRRRWSRGWKYLEEEGRQIAIDLSKDPEQLDPRRLLALEEAMVRQIAVPSEALVMHRARQIASTRSSATMAGEIVSELMATIRSDRTMTMNTRELGRTILREVESLVGEVEVTDVDIELAERELLAESAAHLAALQAHQRAAASSLRIDMVFAKTMIPYFERIGRFCRDLLIEDMPSPELREQSLRKLERGMRAFLAESNAAAKTIEASDS